MVARADARSRWRAFVLLALVTIVGLGAGLAAINSAGRTQGAYDRFVERNAVADVVVNPGLSTTDIDAAIRSLPHVNKVTSSAFLFGGIKRPGPVTLAQLNASIPTEMHGSSDGRFASVDRPAVVAGRLPTGTKEIALTVDYRPAAEKELGRHVGLGETVPVEFFKSPVVEDAADPEVANRPIKPIGIEQLRVVGFVNLADEVLADGLFPRLRVIVSPDVTKRYDCLPAITPTMDEATLFAAMLPDDCALQYRYYAIDVDETANVAAVTAELGRRATKLNRTLPRFLRDNDFNYFLIPTTSADEQRRIDDAIRPTVVALALFGALAAIATLAVVMLVAIRLIRRSERIDDTIRSLGAGRRDRALAIGLPLYATGAFGAFGPSWSRGWSRRAVSSVRYAASIRARPSASIPSSCPPRSSRSSRCSFSQLSPPRSRRRIVRHGIDAPERRADSRSRRPSAPRSAKGSAPRPARETTRRRACSLLLARSR